MFKDNSGNIHATREGAISANFDGDLHDAVQSIGSYSYDETEDNVEMIRVFCKKYPDMVRVLLGDRDAT